MTQFTSRLDTAVSAYPKVSDLHYTPNGDLVDQDGQLYDAETGQPRGAQDSAPAPTLSRPKLADYRGTDAKDLKAKLLASREVFDILDCDEDAGSYSAVWKLQVRYGDGKRGVLFFGVEAQDEEPSARDAAMIAIRAYIRQTHAAMPVRLNGTTTRSGQPYYWLEDAD